MRRKVTIVERLSSGQRAIVQFPCSPSADPAENNFVSPHAISVCRPRLGVKLKGSRSRTINFERIEQVGRRRIIFRTVASNRKP